MSDDPRTRAEQLTAALTDGHERLYMMSPTFHHSVDTLAQLLPIWVDGIAVEAQAADDRAAEAVELAKRLFPGPMVVPYIDGAPNFSAASFPEGTVAGRAAAIVAAHDNHVCRRRHVALDGGPGAIGVKLSCPRSCVCGCHPVEAVGVPGSETLADVERAYVGRVTEEVRARQRGTVEHVHLNGSEAPAHCGWPQDGHTPSPYVIDSGSKCQLPIRGYRAVSPENQTVTYSLPVCTDHGVVATAAGWTVKPLPTSPGRAAQMMAHADLVAEAAPNGPKAPHRFLAIEGTIAGTREPCTVPGCGLPLGDPIHDEPVPVIARSPELHFYEPTTAEGGDCRVCAGQLDDLLHLPEPVDDVQDLTRPAVCICGPRNDDPGDPNPLCPLHGEPI